MERRIGEIFEHNGEWYQCVKGISGERCADCSFKTSPICIDLNCIGYDRKDHTKVIFKKLEKVGEPFLYKEKTMQPYRRMTDALICNWDNKLLLLEHGDSNIIDIEIKQNKDMEEKKLNLKPFSLELAKQGNPVYTRDGRKARIICFDRNFTADGYNFPIVALIKDKNNEFLYSYTEQGLLVKYEEHEVDLMMMPEKKEGWIKVKKDVNLYATKEEADRKMIGNTDYVSAKVEWEE